MARNTQTWILAVTVVLAGCATAPAIDDAPATIAPSTTNAPVPKPDPVTTTAGIVIQESSSLSPATTLPTTTTEAPDASDPESPAIVTEFDLDELDDLIDDLVDDLSGILGDLEQSLAEEEGDVFDD